MTWSTDKELVKRAIFVRVKYKCLPSFSTWCKILDQCHSCMWRAIKFDASINHFGKYDLRATIPCPDDLSKAVTDKSYAKILRS